MYVITLNQKPATKARLKKATKQDGIMPEDEDIYFVGRTRSSAIESFLYHFGFTWPEYKVDGIGVHKVIWLQL